MLAVKTPAGNNSYEDALRAVQERDSAREGCHPFMMPDPLTIDDIIEKNSFAQLFAHAIRSPVFAFIYREPEFRVKFAARHPDEVAIMLDQWKEQDNMARLDEWMPALLQTRAWQLDWAWSRAVWQGNVPLVDLLVTHYDKDPSEKRNLLFWHAFSNGHDDMISYAVSRKAVWLTLTWQIAPTCMVDMCKRRSVFMAFVRESAEFRETFAGLHSMSMEAMFTDWAVQSGTILFDMFNTDLISTWLCTMLKMHLWHVSYYRFWAWRWAISRGQSIELVRTLVETYRVCPGIHGNFALKEAVDKNRTDIVAYLIQFEDVVHRLSEKELYQMIQLANSRKKRRRTVFSMTIGK